MKSNQSDQPKPTSLPVPSEPSVEGYSLSQRAADQCREIVEKTAMQIENKKYVSVEGWQAIAIAHGCVASAGDVEAVYDADKKLVGYKAVGEVRRMSDGVAIARGEGFVGVDEVTWFGGQRMVYGKLKTYQPRPIYAVRAMSQTRSISRACRSAFAHVVVIISKDLSTTPAEEMEGIVLERDAGTSPEKQAEPLPPLKEEAARISQSQGYPPGAKAQGAYRKAGATPTQADLEKKRIAQVEAAYDWIDEHTPALKMMTPDGIKEWEEQPEIKPRLDALRQGRDGQPGYEHLAQAWEKYQLTLDSIRMPPQ